MSLQSTQNSIAEINAEKVYATNHATSGTSYVFDLSAVVDPTSPSAGYLCDASGRMQPLLVLQCDQDFYYAFSTNGSATITTGTSCFVRAGDQEYVRPLAQTGRKYLVVLQSTAAGTLKIFKSAGAK